MEPPAIESPASTQPLKKGRFVRRTSPRKGRGYPRILRDAAGPASYRYFLVAVLAKQLRSRTPGRSPEPAKCTPSVRRHSAAKRRPPSGRTWFDRIDSRSRARHREAILFHSRPATPVHDCDGSKARQPFRRPCARHHPLARKPARHCLAAPRPGSFSLPRRANRLLLRPHSQTTAFESQADQCLAPGTTPAAAALPRLAMGSGTGLVARTRYPPGLSPYVSAFRPSIVSAATPLRAVGDFRRAEPRSSPLPIGERLSQFGTVSGPNYSQALRAFHG